MNESVSKQDEFEPFRKVPTIEEVIENPMTARIRKDDIIAQYITAQDILLTNVTVDNFDKIVDYILRPEYAPHYAVLVIMEAVKKNHNLADTAGFTKWAKECPLLRL